MSPPCVAPRTKAKAEAAAEGVRGAAQGGGAVEPVAGNLASLAEVRRLAEDVKRTHPKLDVLVNNAGAGTESTAYSETARRDKGKRQWPSKQGLPYEMHSIPDRLCCWHAVKRLEGLCQYRICLVLWPSIIPT